MCGFMSIMWAQIESACWKHQKQKKGIPAVVFRRRHKTIAMYRTHTLDNYLPKTLRKMQLNTQLFSVCFFFRYYCCVTGTNEPKCIEMNSIYWEWHIVSQRALHILRLFNWWDEWSYRAFYPGSDSNWQKKNNFQANRVIIKVIDKIVCKWEMKIQHTISSINWHNTMRAHTQTRIFQIVREPWLLAKSIIR